MIFHTVNSVTNPSKGFAPTPGERGVPPPVQPKLSLLRVFLALLLLGILLVTASFAYRSGWDDGAKTLLHMADVLFGLVVGIIFGERQKIG